MAKMKEVLVRIKQYFTKEAQDRANGDTALNTKINNEITRATTAENGKVDKVANATNNNIAILDANGNIKDSGKSINDVGKVATVSVGGGTPIQPDQDKNINLPAYPTAESLGVNLRALITETGNKIDLEIDNTTFKVKAKLYDKNNTLISTSNEIDLPLESVVVGGRYDSVNKKVVLTLQNGTTIEFSVADLVYGLQSEITANNPLSSDLVDDTNSLHKFVSANDKTKWDNKRDDLYIIELDKKTFDEKVLTAEQLAKIIENPYNVAIYEAGDIYHFSKDATSNYYYYEGNYRFTTQNSKLNIMYSQFKINKTSGAWDFETITGLSQAPITSSNKVNADYIDDTNSNNKFVSANEKTTWNGKQNAIGDLQQIREGASAGATAVQDENYVHTDNNYTTAEKNKLAGLSNYDDTVVMGKANKSLYHLGAFDSADGKTRQTGYAKSFEELVGQLGTSYYDDGTPSWANSRVSVNTTQFANGEIVANVPVMTTGQAWNYAGSESIVIGYQENRLSIYGKSPLTNSDLVKASIQIQYKLATSYTDTPIENQSILPLDSNMANKIRQKVVDGLNLITGEMYKDSSNNYGFVFSCKQTGTYTFSIDTSVIIISCDLKGGSNVGVSENSNKLTLTLQAGNDYAFFVRDSDGWNSAIKYKSSAMLTQSTHPYPYADFNQKEHITNDEATLLKQEEEKCRNLFNKDNVVEGYWIDVQSGSLITSSVDCYSNYYVEVNGQTQISAYFNGNPNNWCGICFYDSNKTFISGVEMGSPSNNRPITTTIPSNCKYIRITSSIANKGILMVNFGTSAKPYQAYNGAIIHQKDLEPESIPQGTINEALGYDVDGKLVRGTAGGGSQETLIWENSSPLDAFAATTITLPSKPADGMYRVDFKSYMSMFFKLDSTCKITWITGDPDSRQAGVACVETSGSTSGSGGSMVNRSRSVSIMSYTMGGPRVNNLIITDCTRITWHKLNQETEWSLSSTLDNGQMVPTRIVYLG